MSGNRLVFNGLAELRAQLRNLPAELTAEASRITEASANSAAAAIKQAYPKGETGNLIAGVTVTHFDKGRFSAGAILKNRAKHAAIFEYGTQARHTSLGRNRGAMPPGRVFIPIVIEKRRQMFEAFKAMLTRHGLRVGNG